MRIFIKIDKKTMKKKAIFIWIGQQIYKFAQNTHPVMRFAINVKIHHVGDWHACLKHVVG